MNTTLARQVLCTIEELKAGKCSDSAAQAQQDLAWQRFEAGVGSRLPWLAAQSGVLAQRRQSLELQARALDAHAGLMRALGGGWRDTDSGSALAGATPTELK